MGGIKLTPQVSVVIPPELQRAALIAAQEAMPGCGISGAVRLALTRLAGMPDQSAKLPMGRPRKIQATD